MALVRWLLLVVGLVLSPAVSQANGRFPEANQLVVDAADPRHLVVRTSFGILRSFDGGGTWTWTCEEAISPLGLVDEEMLVSTEGRTLVALGDGIATTADRQGCHWNRVPGDVSDQHVLDMAGDHTDRAVAYAAVNIIISGSFHGRIAKTRDGVSWRFIGDVLQSTVPLTIDIAPSRPDRLYLGVNDGNFEFGYIDVSDDGGLTWARHAPPAGVDSVYISGVDPHDADRVYVRQTFPDNALHVSEDGAVSWRVIYTGVQPLKGFAISPDGQQIAVGGEDGFAVLTKGEVPGGPTTFTSSPRPSLTVKCLTWSPAGLYACADDTNDGFTIGLSVDGGWTFRPLLRLADLKPAWCPGGTSVAQFCPQRWCDSASKFDASCAPAVMPDGPREAGPSSGCGCALAPRPHRFDWSSLLLLAASLATATFRRQGAFLGPLRRRSR